MLSKNLELIIPQLEELTRSLFPEILKIYQNPRSNSQEKKDGSPVTAADMYAHKVIVKFLKKDFPDIPVVSEESFKQKNYKPAKEFWIIDPIDGTKEFVNKSDEFTTNIALIQNGKPILGVVGAPAFDQVCVHLGKRVASLLRLCCQPVCRAGCASNQIQALSVISFPQGPGR